MTAPHADQLIDGYLARIAAAAADFPAGARNELLDDMRSHIAEARTREPEETDASILNILDRLGEPSTVVADGRERLGLRTQPVARPGLIEVGALALLILFWPIGVVLLWLSSLWNTRDKIIGSVFTLGGYLTIFFVGASLSFQVAPRGGCTSVSVTPVGTIGQTVCSGPSALDIIGALAQIGLALLLFLLPIVTLIYLAVRLRSKARRLVPATA